MCERETYSRHENWRWETERGRLLGEVRWKKWTFLGSCRAWSASGDLTSNVKERGLYCDTVTLPINMCSVPFRTAVPFFHTYLEILAYHQNKRLRSLSCQLAITGLVSMTTTRDGDTESLVWLLNDPAAFKCLRWICYINELILVPVARAMPVNGFLIPYLDTTPNVARHFEKYNTDSGGTGLWLGFWS